MRNIGLAKRFVAHHQAHPEVWKAYELLALVTISSGRENFGIGALTEMLRWDKSDLGEPASGYKLTNDFRAFYARMFAHSHPEHAELFRYSESAADYVDYACLLCGDIEGALGWVDPQLSLPLETEVM